MICGCDPPFVVVVSSSGGGGGDRCWWMDGWMGGGEQSCLPLPLPGLFPRLSSPRLACLLAWVSQVLFCSSVLVSHYHHHHHQQHPL